MPRPSALLAEFLVCVTVVGLSPTTDKHNEDRPADWMARMSAVCGVFFLLSLLASAGPRPHRAAVGFGGLVTLGLAISERSVFTTIAQRLRPPTPSNPAIGAVTGALDDLAVGRERNAVPVNPPVTQPIPGRPGIA